jgi:ribonuclease BN (tRNA processing enzyme)
MLRSVRLRLSAGVSTEINVLLSCHRRLRHPPACGGDSCCKHLFKRHQYVAFHSSRLVAENSDSTEDTAAPHQPIITNNYFPPSSAAGSIYKPPQTIIDDTEIPYPVFFPLDNETLAHSIRSCIKRDDDYEKDGDTTSHQLQTEMSICFLGTSSGIPTRHRSTSATLLRLGGASFLFDAGEGVQRQFQFVKGLHKLSRIERIFITHLHGDHIFGLPGLLLGMQDQARVRVMNENERKEKQTRPRRHEGRIDENVDENGLPVVKIYGPPGLFHYIASSMILSCTKLHHIRIEVYELVGGRVKRISSPIENNRQQRMRNPFYDDYPEYYYGGIMERKQIQCKDGVWNIEDEVPITREMVVHDNRGGSRVATKRLDRFRIRAAELDHLHGIATFGFVVEEPEPARNIDAAKAKALGVSPLDKKYELLKYGFSVVADDGSEREVHPHEVLKPVMKKARKVAILGDNRKWTKQMTDIAQNADVLVHEATLLEEDYQRGHSTAAMAGRRAAECNADLLIINHISPKCEDDLPGTAQQAYEASEKRSSVLAAFDFMEVLIPWMGYGKNESNNINGDVE